MRKILNNHVYDTSTARLVTSCEYSGQDSDATASLYRKINGEYFLYTTGNARDTGKITLLTYAEAQAWARTRMSVDQYAKYFTGASAEGKTTIHMCVSNSLAKKLRMESERTGISASSIISTLLERM